MMPVYQSFGPGIIGAGNPIALDYMPNSWITVTVEPIGTMSGLVQVSLDQFFDQNSPDYISLAAASWFPVAVPAVATAAAPYAPMLAQTAAFYLTFPGPWRAIRYLSTVNGTGTVFAVAQSVAPRA